MVLAKKVSYKPSFWTAKMMAWRCRAIPAVSSPRASVRLWGQHGGRIFSCSCVKLRGDACRASFRHHFACARFADGNLFFSSCFGWALVVGSSYVLEQGFRFQGPTITLSMRHLPYCAWYRHELSLLYVFFWANLVLPMINVGWE